MKRAVIITVATLLLLTALALLFEPTGGTATTQQPELTKYEVGPPDATEILELVNVQRTKVGVEPLTYDPRLEKSAQLKAEYMAKHNKRDHQLVEDPSATLTVEMGSYTTHCDMTSENVTAHGTTSRQAIWAWTNSEPHYKAMINPKYSSTGIGVTYDEDQDWYYSVQHFCVAQ